LIYIRIRWKKTNTDTTYSIRLNFKFMETLLTKLPCPNKQISSLRYSMNKLNANRIAVPLRTLNSHVAEDTCAKPRHSQWARIFLSSFDNKGPTLTCLHLSLSLSSPWSLAQMRTKGGCFEMDEAPWAAQTRWCHDLVNWLLRYGRMATSSGVPVVSPRQGMDMFVLGGSSSTRWRI
jgi:hypothetical protein